MGTWVYFEVQKGKETLSLSEYKNGIPLFLQAIFSYASTDSFLENLVYEKNDALDEESYKQAYLIRDTLIPDSENLLEPLFRAYPQAKLVWLEIKTALNQLIDDGWYLKLNIFDYANENLIGHFDSSISNIDKQFQYEKIKINIVNTMNEERSFYAKINNWLGYFYSDFFNKFSIEKDMPVLFLLYEESILHEQQDIKNKNLNAKRLRKKEKINTFLFYFGCTVFVACCIFIIVIEGFSFLTVLGILFFGAPLIFKGFLLYQDMRSSDKDKTYQSKK